MSEIQASDVKSFTMRRKKADDPDPVVPFLIDGERFELHPARVNGLVLMDLGSMAISQDSQPMWEFFQGVLGDDYQRFRRHVRDPNLDIDPEDIRDLVQWISEQVTEIPTRPSSS